MKTKFFLSVFLVSFFIILSQTISLADDSITGDVSPGVSPVLSPIITMENKEIQYDLPYPGLLPDNPLYVLKVFRDNIVSFFISSPSKKADYDLLQADKRMNASIYLSHEKPVNDTLISSTVSKAINYFDQSISQTQLAMQQTEDIKSFVQHMDTASKKYRQVILQLETNASQQLKGDLVEDQKRLDGIQSEIKKMGK
jgi:hypothetical protein